ncbi:hypothetical protein LTR56_016222 [Elasticomyces elasticus]|nr:hypothetical protein LTR56_016222 [Elasticomyces elasticus]KAK3636063.1 hypothetical protein LTR22_018910 [Elasticomyces elasticus]
MSPKRKLTQPALADDRGEKRVTRSKTADTRTTESQGSSQSEEMSQLEAAGTPGERSEPEDIGADNPRDEIDSENGSDKAQSETTDTAIEPDDVSLTHAATIDVHVGPLARRFGVPKSLIRSRSVFIDAAIRFNEQNKTGNEPIELSRDVPSIFDQYLQVLYSQDLVRPEDLQEDDEWLINGLIKPYRLANKLQDQISADTLIDKIAAHTHYADIKQLTAENLIRAWAMAPPDSTLCNVLVDSVILQLAPDNLNYYLSARDFPRDFAVEIARKLAATAVGVRNEWNDQLSDLRNASRTPGAYHRFGTIDEKFKDARVPPDAPATVTGPAE